WIVAMIPAISPVGLPSTGRIVVDLRVVAVTFGLSFLAGIISGVAPAIRGGLATPGEGLKEGTRISSGGRRRIRSTLVVAEVALALVLLVGAGLMIKSFARLAGGNAGFGPKDVLGVDLSPAPARYSQPARQREAVDQPP